MVDDGTNITEIHQSHNLSGKKIIRSIFFNEIAERGNYFVFLSKTSVSIYRQSQILRFDIKIFKRKRKDTSVENGK